MTKKQSFVLTVTGSILSLFYLSPFYLVAVNSFKTKRELFENQLRLPDVWIIGNYLEAFAEMNYLKSLFNSLVITLSVLFLILIISSSSAWMILRNKGKFSTFFLYALISSLMVPFQAIMFPLLRLLNISQLTSPLGLIIVQAGFGLPLSVFLFFGFIKGLPRSLEEAAIIESCTAFQIYGHIIVPLIKPMAVTVAILNGLWVWNGFLMPSLILKKESYTLPLSMFYFFGQYTKQWNLALAGLTMSIIPIVIFYMFAQKSILSGITAGSNK